MHELGESGLPDLLEGGDYDAGDTVVLDADGAYKRKRGPVDALRVPGTSFSVAAFFHVQEWKKKWRSFSVSWVATSDTILGTRFGLVPVLPCAEINQSRSRGKRRADGVERPNFDFHAGAAPETSRRGHGHRAKAARRAVRGVLRLQGLRGHTPGVPAG